MAANSGIYFITAPSGSVYVGSSIRLNRRKVRHFSDMRHGRHHCEALNRAWRKYGDKMIFTVVEYCGASELMQREQWWIDQTIINGDILLNSRLTAENTGNPLSEHTKKKISDALIGRKVSDKTRFKMRRPKSEAHAAAISAGKKGTNNIVWTAEERKKRSQAMRKQWANGERDQVSHINQKIWRDQDHRRTRIESMRASWTPERRATHAERIRQRHAGRDLALEALERINWIAWG